VEPKKKHKIPLKAVEPIVLVILQVKSKHFGIRFNGFPGVTVTKNRFSG
jgi:hypothetical protein